MAPNFTKSVSVHLGSDSNLRFFKASSRKPILPFKTGPAAGRLFGRFCTRTLKVLRENLEVHVPSASDEDGLNLHGEYFAPVTGGDATRVAANQTGIIIHQTD
jgi:hypothetical protein